MINFDLVVSGYFFQLGRSLPPLVAPFLAVALIWILFAFVFYRSSVLGAKRDKIQFLLRAGAAALLALAVNAAIAYFYFRARPFAALGFDPLISKSALDKSFPSDHAVVAWALAAGLYFNNKTSGYWAGLAALLICLGRVLAGVHYISDVAAGAAIGVLAAGAVFKLSAPRGSIRGARGAAAKQ